MPDVHYVSDAIESKGVRQVLQIVQAVKAHLKKPGHHPFRVPAGRKIQGSIPPARYPEGRVPSCDTIALWARIGFRF